ncbi:MAG TPA: phosphatidylserine decarboxylase [Terriglobales bacterium]|jgi:phosphatidylserine decarboxylase|nr:phosphatidylserine decarboxylase [Terriglobales bacterium]
MVRDGYFYGGGCLLAAGVIVWLAAWAYAVPLLLLCAFFLWFFRDPERQVPTLVGAVVSPGDGKVTDVSIVGAGGTSRHRISIFLSVFDVHVNRSPISGVIREVRYQRGKFLNAMSAHSAEENEQNIITVEGEGRTVIFKQIAGLIARRIVFNFKVGDQVACGERVGLIKFGSRVDVLFDSDAAIQVKLGDRVKGGATVIALLPVTHPVSASAAGEREAGSI